MTPQEHLSKVRLKTEIMGLKIRTYDRMRELARMDEAELRACGYKSVAEALTDQMDKSQEELERREAELLRKHPD